MHEGRWRHIADTYVKLGNLKSNYSLEGFLYDPEPVIEVSKLRNYLYAGIVFVCFGGFIIFTLIWFNHRLKYEISERKQAEHEFRASEKRFRFMFEKTADALLLFDPDAHQFIDCNQAAADLFGFKEKQEELLVHPALLSPSHQPDGRASKEKAEQMIQIAMQQGSHRFEWIHCSPHRDDFPAEVLLTPIQMGDQQLVISTLRDISGRKKAEEKLQLAASVFSYAREGILITDAQNRIVEANQTFTQMTGYSREEVLGTSPSMFQSGRQGPIFYAAMWKELLEQHYWHGELWNQNKNGKFYAILLTISAVLDDNGNTVNYVALITDITPMKDYQRQLEHIAHYDILTNLPNRVLLADRLQQAINQSQRHNQSLAVVYLDLDGFKAVNDTYGHEAGDQLLITVSQRMKEALREVDTLSRIGGDEFVAVLVDLEQLTDCELVLERLLQAAAQPVSVAGVNLQVSASIGLTIYPQDTSDPDQLMRHADQAMYIAKQAGKNRYHLFDAHQDIVAKAQQESLECIRWALNRNEFVLHYQPKVNLITGEVIGVEALIRWQHPEQGLVTPAEFLPIIENHPMSLELGDWVINTALTQISEWQTAGLKIPISVNVDVYQLQKENFLPRLAEQLTQHPEVKPCFLELEVLETRAMEDISLTSVIMHSCRELGVHFALDDFGTGYSSLTYLKRLPVDTLKINQSFVRNMLDDQEDQAIVKGVIGLATAFNHQVIAEGVETLAHGTQLLSLGCEFAQGYGIARPMSAIAIPDWMDNWKSDLSNPWRSIEQELYDVWIHEDLG